MLPGSVSLTSTERYPPRASVQDGRLPPLLEGALVAQFERGMRQNSSGRYADGSLRRRFHVSVRHHPPASDVILRLSPLSRYDRTRLDADPVVVHWRVGGGHDGQFTLIENGAEQQFVIPGCRSALAFVHVNCWSEYGGTAVPADDRLPGRRIIGYLHAIDSSPAAGFGDA